MLNVKCRTDEFEEMRRRRVSLASKTKLTERDLMDLAYKVLKSSR